MPPLHEAAHEPFAIFEVWFAEAGASEPDVPNAMQLATVARDGHPRARTVLLKGHDPRGFVFYTNLESQKALDLAHHAHAALTFHWKSLQRQVHVLGVAESVADEEADAYFASRPRGSQLGAWASAQSRPIEAPGALEQALAEVTARFGDGPVPRPPHWSGYRVKPHVVEFWQGQPDRLHDRVVFQRTEAGWSRHRVYP